MGKESQSEDAFPFHIRSTSGTSIRKTCQVEGGGGGGRWAAGGGGGKGGGESGRQLGGEW